VAAGNAVSTRSVRDSSGENIIIEDKTTDEELLESFPFLRNLIPDDAISQEPGGAYLTVKEDGFEANIPAGFPPVYRVHEAAHLALRHWKLCGKAVELACDLALRSLIPVDDSYLTKDLPEAKAAEFYLRYFTLKYPSPATYGLDSPFADQYVKQKARDFMDGPDADMSELDTQIAFSCATVDEFDVFVDDLPMELRMNIVRDWEMCKKVFRLAYTDRLASELIELRRFGLVEDLSGSFIIGSAKDVRLESKSIIAGILTRVEVHNSTVSAIELKDCTLMGCCKGSALHFTNNTAMWDVDVESPKSTYTRRIGAIT
jgi:hypothetical protein